MTVAELHIRTNQRYQEIASNKRDTFFPEEIDLALNTAQDRFIIKEVEAFLQDKQTDLAAIAPLVVKNRVLPAIIPSSSDDIYEDNMVYSVLPSNLKFLLNARAEVIYNTDMCGGAPTLGTTVINEYVAVVPLPDSGSAPFYPEFRINGGSTFAEIYSVAGTTYDAGFSSNKGVYRLVNGAMSFFNTLKKGQLGYDLEVYWERYRGRYYKNSFIFVSPSNQGSFRVSITGANQTTSMTNTVRSVYNRQEAVLDQNLSLSFEESKPIESRTLYAIQKKNKYYRSRIVEPIVHQTQDYLMAYMDESFLVTRQAIDYVRKPREISLALNQSCELETAVFEIIDLAVEILRLDTEAKTYPQTVQDTELRNKL